MTKQDLQIRERYNAFPKTLEHINDLIETKNVVLRDNLIEDISKPFDIDFLDEHFILTIETFPFFCQFPNTEFRKKIANSSCFKSLKQWIIPMGDIYEKVDCITEKYKTLDKDLILFLSSLYVSINIIEELKQIKKCYGTIPLDLSENYHKNLFRRINYKPEILKHSKEFIEDFASVIMGERLKRKGLKNTTNVFFTLEDFFGKHNPNPQDFIDNIMLISTYIITNELGSSQGKKTIKMLIDSNRSHQLFHLLPLENIKPHSQREMFRDFFQLFKLIMPDAKLFDESQYKADCFNRDAKVDDSKKYRSYNDYMTAKSKIIMGKTR